MSRFLSLFTGIGGKKYAPPPPDIDYRSPEVYNVTSPASFHSDDADIASISTEYCDPEDVLRGRGPGRIDSDSEYSVPCEGSDAVYYSAVAGPHAGDTRELPDSTSEQPDDVYRPWLDNRCSFVSCAEGFSVESHSNPSLKVQQQLPTRDDPGRSHAGGHDNEDYDCPWDTGVLESQVYQMMKERMPSCTQSETEMDQPRSAGCGVASKTPDVTAKQQSSFAFRPGSNGSGSPAGGGGEADWSETSPVYSDACQDQLAGQPLSFANSGYFIPDSGPDELRATVVSPAAEKSESRKPLALPRDRKVLDGGTYVNHRRPLVSPPHAPLPSLPPALASLPTDDDPLAGTYDDPWDLRKLEEVLASKEDELCRATATAKMDSMGSPEHGGTETCSKRTSIGPAADAATRNDSSSPLAQRKVLGMAAAFGSAGVKPGPAPCSLQLQRTVSCSGELDGGGGGSVATGGAALSWQQQQQSSAATNSRKPNSPVARPLPAASGVGVGGSGGQGYVPLSPVTPRPTIGGAVRDGSGNSSRPQQLQLQQQQPQSAASVASAAVLTPKTGIAIGPTKMLGTPAVGSYGSIAKELNEVLAQKSLGTPAIPTVAPDKRADLASGTGRHVTNGKSDVTARPATAAQLPLLPVPAAVKLPADPRLTGRPMVGGAAAVNSSAPATGYGTKGSAGAATSPFVKNPVVVGQPTTPTAERKRPQVPLKQQRWFHGDITRQQAEDLLQHEPVGSFLVRVSSTGKQDYSLSLRVPSYGAIHLKITLTDGQYILGQFSQPFNSIAEMIDHYSNNPITIRHAEHLKLEKGVCRLQQ